MWVEGCDRTRRDATLRYVTLFSLLAVSYRRCPSNRGKEERQKVGRVDALLRRLGRPAGFTCADARGRVKEKKGVAPPHPLDSYFHVYTTWKKGRGQRKKAARGGRVGGRGVRDERAAEEGRKRRERKGCSKRMSGGVREAQQGKTWQEKDRRRSVQGGKRR